jgi:hypothetical protein
MEHPFVFTSGEWLGEGTIQLSMSEDPLQFVTKWKLLSSADQRPIELLQEVQIKGISETMLNHFTLSDFESKSFLIKLENNTLGKVEGKGVVNPEVIGWEFNSPEANFQGFEFYEKLNDNEYSMRAEYASDDEYRTLITGKIWRKVSP